MDLFDAAGFSDKLAPLAERMRAKTMEEFVGQSHIVGQGSLLRRAIGADKLGNCIFYGPPGTGKTTLANIIAQSTNAAFEKLNAVVSGVADAKRVIDEARERLRMYGKRTYLLLDECHRWSKAQSDSVLAAIEQGTIVFIGSTTENPYVSMTKAIISRCRVFEFKRLSEDDIRIGLKRAIADKTHGLGNMDVAAEDSALNLLAWASDGDLRTAYNALELAALTTVPGADGRIVITEQIAGESIQRKALSVDESMYYDMISAFIKSMRGSDSNAAVYWSERLLSAGCDPLLICRRVMIHAAEDVGMADPNALVVAASAVTAFERIGLPEGRLPLTEAIIYVAEAPKSNSVCVALNAANQAVQRVKRENVPKALQDPNYKGEKISGYKYPHDFPGGWVEQQYLPDGAKNDVYYTPSEYGFEAEIRKRHAARKKK
ncbi:MAG: replication-associated recombination protein A [Clostridiaceae bacterium]|jgi:putative ATPase|nr:replication-associated recombination protein A [Clostridiaceae bacterium]